MARLRIRNLLDRLIPESASPQPEFVVPAEPVDFGTLECTSKPGPLSVASAIRSIAAVSMSLKTAAAVGLSGDPAYLRACAAEAFLSGCIDAGWDCPAAVAASLREITQELDFDTSTDYVNVKPRDAGRIAARVLAKTSHVSDADVYLYASEFRDRPVCHRLARNPHLKNEHLDAAASVLVGDVDLFTDRPELLDLPVTRRRVVGHMLFSSREFAEMAVPHFSDEEKKEVLPKLIKMLAGLVLTWAEEDRNGVREIMDPGMLNELLCSTDQEIRRRARLLIPAITRKENSVSEPGVENPAVRQVPGR